MSSDSFEYHPLFGLVHSAGECQICDAYCQHVSRLKHSTSPSFRRVLDELYSATFTPYFEGLEEGQRRERILHCSHPSDAFRQGVLEGERRAENLTKVIIQERDLAVRSAADLAERLRSLTEIVIVEQPGSDFEVVKPSPSPASTATPSAPISESPKPAPSVQAPTPAPAPLCTDHQDEPNERVLKALRDLMRRAHSGDTEALFRVKAMCREAHATPTEQKTFAQKVILSEWRVPLEIRQASVASGRRPPPRQDDVPGLVNPRLEDGVDVWYNYYCYYKSSLPRGVPQDAAGRPVRSYLSASRTFARLRPPPDTPSPQRMEFITSMIKLFTTPGAYAITLRKERLEIAARKRFRPFVPQPGVAISTDEVAKHFASCGVNLMEARDELEPWAHEYEKTGRPKEVI
ncbi:hypothetical protein VKT23_011271 [Stygiomarasmius scandens]|uniref:Uncharacterized protein n=1 Tax=Marasmiellus scandens TaxID=2682957 RepID=A0ABR1J9T7_9AGAR